MVSVIIPVYNGEQFLEECLDSVIGQSYQNLEIIIIDDGSTDNSYKICQKYAEKDSRIVLIHQENAGVSAARNRGLAIANGAYISFVDVDDKLTDGAIELLVGHAEDEIDLVVGSHEEFRGKKSSKVIRRAERVDFSENVVELPRIAKILTTPWAKLFRREIIHENGIRFDINLPYGEDNLFNLEYCRKIQSIEVIGDIVYLYRKGGFASSIRYYPDMNEMSLKLLDTYLELLYEKNYMQCDIKGEIQNRIAGCAFHYAANCSYIFVLQKVSETINLYHAFLDERNIISYNGLKSKEEIFEMSARDFVNRVYKEQFIRIVLKKGKKLCTRLLKKRI